MKNNFINIQSSYSFLKGNIFFRS